MRRGHGVASEKLRGKKRKDISALRTSSRPTPNQQPQCGTGTSQVVISWRGQRRVREAMRDPRSSDM